MIYYRFRPYSELSLKELLYSEMYFSSTEECNDPFDSKTFYTFSKDVDKWVNLILLALGSVKPKPALTGEQLKAFTEHYCGKCPLTFNEIIDGNLLDDFDITSKEDEIIKNILELNIPKILKVYKPSARYFVSFSKEAKETLMWSHYANRHKGFCLIFRPIDGRIKQFKYKQKRQIRRKTPKSFASEMSFEMPKEFKVSDIEYLGKVKSSDAFIHMPVAVSGDAKNDAHREKIRKEQESHYLQKGKSWQYEKEARIILSPPPSWLFGEQIEYTNQERLFHYEPGHLVGIIYGALLTDNEKTRIYEILNERREWNYEYPDYKKIEFHFMEFNAKLAMNEREINIEPFAISNYKRIYKDEKDFDRLYKDWQDGWGFERDNKSSKRIKVE